MTVGAEGGPHKAPCFLGKGLLVGRGHTVLSWGLSSSVEPFIPRCLGEKDQPGISGGSGRSAELGCVSPVPGSRSRHPVPSARVAPERRPNLRCLCSAGAVLGDPSSPIGHLLDRDLACLRPSSAEALASSPLTGEEASLRQVRPVSPPVWMGSGWMTRPRSGHRGLLPGVEGARSWHECLVAGWDVTALDFPWLGSSGSGAACPWKGLRRGLRCRSLSAGEGWRAFSEAPLRSGRRLCIQAAIEDTCERLDERIFLSVLFVFRKRWKHLHTWQRGWGGG